MKHTVKTVWNIITNILVGLVVLLAIALVGVRLVGIQVDGTGVPCRLAHLCEGG